VIRETLGRYHVEAEIGRGAMGVVYRARDPRIDRVVAIKTISLAETETTEEQEYRERFAQEARAAGHLAHPGIVTIFDAGEDPETREPFFVMELVAGQPLSEEIAAAGGRLPLPKALQIACQVADALQYAHSQGVVHGDIKPANILISREGKAKIADFGVARLNQSVATHAGKMFGSPAYMAPEQLGGAEPDARSDLFSLGVLLYSMLTGFRPFQGNSAQTVCFKVMNVEPVPVSSLQADLPPELDRIVQRAIAKDATERYQCGADLSADLRAFVSNDDSFAEATHFFNRLLEPEQPGATLESQRPLLTRRHAVEAAAAVVLIALVLTGMEFRQNYRQAAMLLPPPVASTRAPGIQKTPPEPVIHRKIAHRSIPAPAMPGPSIAPPAVETAPVRVEILHHLPSGKASVWFDNKLVLEEDLHASTQGGGLFRYVVMNQTANLQFPLGKHELEVRVVSAGSYDETAMLKADLTAGPLRRLYVNCTKKKLLVSLQ
jgi:serine/threonine-protein kinase